MQVFRNLFSLDCSWKDQFDANHVISRNLTTWLNNVDAIEKTHKEAADTQVPPEQEASQALKVRRLRMDTITALEITFTAAMNEIAKAKLDPSYLPRDIALQLSEVICRYGIKCYADNDLSHPFQCSLNILQAALLMQQYGLGLSDRSPDLSALHGLDDLYNLDHLKVGNTAHVEFVMDKMEPAVWAEKAAQLPASQLVILSKTLRYINGCMRNIEPHLARQEALIQTAVACLQEGASKHVKNAAQINNELAEVRYNDLTGILKAKAEKFQQQGEYALAEHALEKLRQQWDECIKLSDDPDLMLSRCTNKRFFFEKVSPEEELIQRKRALEIHLSRPKECQRPILIALAWHNLSMFHQTQGNILEAVTCVNEALKVTSQCLARGENNVDLVRIRENAERLAELLKN